MNAEIWKSVVGFEGRYEVSSLGRVRSLTRPFLGRWGKMMIRRGCILKPRPARHGYLRVALFDGNGAKTRRDESIHVLVAEAFLSKPATATEVNHKSGIKTDNRFTELEWSTRLENVRHAIKTALRPRRFDAQTILSIRSICAASGRQSFMAIGRQFGVSESMIRAIHYRRQYADFP